MMNPRLQRLKAMFASMKNRKPGGGATQHRTGGFGGFRKKKPKPGMEEARPRRPLTDEEESRGPKRPDGAEFGPSGRRGFFGGRPGSPMSRGGGKPRLDARPDMGDDEADSFRRARSGADIRGAFDQGARPAPMQSPKRPMFQAPKEQVDETGKQKPNMQEVMRAMIDKAKKKLEQSQTRMGNVAERSRDMGRQSVDRAREGFDRGREEVRRRPKLASGAAGAAVGAAAGAAYGRKQGEQEGRMRGIAYRPDDKKKMLKKKKRPSQGGSPFGRR